MKFENKQEAFNYYNSKTIEEVEQRASEIKKEIETNANADIDSLNIELDGLKEAKENMKEKSNQEQRSFNPITSQNFETRASEEATNGDVYASKEYRNAFYKNLLGQEMTTNERKAFNRAMEIEARANAYSTSTNTAVVLPTNTLNEVISKARTIGGLLAHVRMFNMPVKVSVPIATPSGNAIWNTEGAEVESEQPSIVEVAFDGYEIIKVFSISAKVKTMSIDAFESYLVEELTNCVLATLDDGIVNGTGSGQGTGILKGITWNTSGDNINAIEYTTDITYKNIVSAMGMLKRGYGANAKFSMNSATLYNQIYGLTDQNKRPIFIGDAQGDTIGRILSKDVVVDDNIEDGTIIYGNFAYYGVNLPSGVAVESSNQSSFKSGRIDYRGMAIADCKPIVKEAFIKISKASSSPSV